MLLLGLSRWSGWWKGVDGVAFSHAGVKFLLREMARSEGELLASPQLYRFVVLRSYLARLVHTHHERAHPSQRPQSLRPCRPKHTTSLSLRLPGAAYSRVHPQLLAV
jgi:hypothetical protein